MAEWARILNTTIHEYVREVEDNIMRDRKLLALLKSKGRITYNHAGDVHNWRIRFKRAPMRIFRESETLTFNRVNRWKQAELGWAGYQSGDAVTKLEKLKNKNQEAIIKFYSTMTEALVDDITENFGDEFYVDGNLAANAGRISGMETWFGVSGAATQGYIGTPSDTYAGLSTALGNYGGNWSTSGGTTTWPLGSGDAEYDFWSPLVVDYTDTAWTASTKTFPNTCEEAVAFGIINMLKNKSKKGMLGMIMFERDLYRQFKDKVRAKENLYVTRGESGDGIYALGFKDVINFDGVDVTHEYGVPATVGYGVAPMHLELMSLQDKLFVAETPDFDLASYTERFSIDFFGQMKANPRYMLKFDNVT